MLRIGGIVEGPTDHWVIENIILGYFDGNEDHFEYIQLQPVTDATDDAEANTHGSWSHVIKYCQSTDKLQKHLDNLDFTIIQIDSDISALLYVNLTGQESVEEICEIIGQKLIQEIGEETFNRFSGKIVFAVSVHMIECWLLTLYGKDNKVKSQIHGCIKRVNKALDSTKFKFRLSESDKDVDHYMKLSDPFSKRSILEKAVPLNPSLFYFYNQLSQKIPR